MGIVIGLVAIAILAIIGLIFYEYISEGFDSFKTEIVESEETIRGEGPLWFLCSELSAGQAPRRTVRGGGVWVLGPAGHIGI